MLSTKVFKSSSNARDYYSHADYYGADAKGEWFGEGTKTFGLSGVFDAKTSQEFKDLLEGKTPDGRSLGLMTGTGEIMHSPGVDLTFSSPKSFSVQMHVLGSKEEKEKLESARMAAIHKTLSYIETNGIVYTRKGAQGKIREEVNTLTFALFTHTTNRKLEPQDHVHCLLANVVKCNDGKYRTIAIDDLIKNNKFIGQIFRNELALEVQKIGYDIRTTILSDGSSSFELKDVSQNIIDAFSTRRKELVELFKYYDVKTKEGKDRIVINSREAKKTMSEKDLKETWHKIAAEVLAKEKEHKSKSSDTLLDKVRDVLDKTIYREANQLKPVTVSLDEIAKQSLADVTHHNSTFNKSEITKIALKQAIGKHGIGDIDKSISHLLKKKEIVQSMLGDSLLTSKELLNKEREILKIAKQGISKKAAVIKTAAFTKRYSHFENNKIGEKLILNKQQQSAVRHILTSDDRITAIQGLPGVGKSTVLDRIRAMSAHKVKYVGLAPTASAAKTLQESSHIPSQTLHSFIGKYRGYLEGRGTEASIQNLKNEFKHTTVIVDEASLIGTRQMYDLLKLSEILRFRTVLVGDTKQLSAVEAGKPFEQLLPVVKSVTLDTIIRQKDQSHIDAIKSVADNKILESFKIHDKNIIDSKAFTNEAVKQYLSLTPRERDHTILISPSREHRDEINHKIITQLSKEGVIKGPSYGLEVLKPLDLTKSDYGFARSYQVRNQETHKIAKEIVVKFNKNYQSLGIEKEDMLIVAGSNETLNTLMFKKGMRNVRFQLKPGIDYATKFEVFVKDRISIQEGMKLCITKNDNKNQLINSEVITIKNLNIQDKTIRFTQDATIRTIVLSDLKHLDYGYCSTVHSSQGKTTDRLIAAICYNKKLNDQKSWIVSISRHKYDLHVYMQDRDQIQKTLMMNKGIEKSSLDIVNCNSSDRSETF